MSAELETPFGRISAAPASLDGSTVALWLIGVLVVVVAIAVVCLWRVLMAEKTDAKERERQAQERCDNERKSLVGRLDHLSDAVFQSNRDVVERNTVALAQNVEWFRRFVEDTESGQHRTMDRYRTPRPGL